MFTNLTNVYKLNKCLQTKQMSLSDKLNKKELNKSSDKSGLKEANIQNCIVNEQAYFYFIFFIAK